MPALAPRLPPTASMASAICCAERVAVPLVSRAAVALARPALSAGSKLLPDLRIMRRETSGCSCCSMTTTHKPLPRVFCSNEGKRTSLAAAGGGPASLGLGAGGEVWACAVVAVARRRRAAAKRRRLGPIDLTPTPLLKERGLERVSFPLSF